MNREMENNEYYIPQQGYAAEVATKTFITQVFLWMTFAMAITAVTAYMFASSESLIMSLRNPVTGGLSGLGWIVTLAPIGFVLLMSLGFQKLSPALMALLFIAFSILMGMSLSFILLVYTSASVFKTFTVTAAMFGGMSVLGYTTKTDLTRFGSLMMMGLFGIIIAMLVNMFLHSGTMDYIISIIGVLVFTGLTAYDVQKLKRMSQSGMEAMGDGNVRKMSIMGALTLYLDFINLFLFLLRFLGNRR